MSNEFTDLLRTPLGEATISVPAMEVQNVDHIMKAIIKEAEVHCVFWGVDRDRVIVWTWLGRILFKVESVGTSGMVSVQFVPGEEAPNKVAAGEWHYCFCKFWIHKSKLRSLSECLRSHLEQQVPFMDIFMGTVERPALRSE